MLLLFSVTRVNQASQQRNLNVPCTDEDNSLFLFFQRHLLTCSYKFYFHCTFIIYPTIIIVVLTKKNLFLRDFFVMRPLFRLSTLVQKRQESASKVPFIGFVRV